MNVMENLVGYWKIRHVWVGVGVGGGKVRITFGGGKGVRVRITCVQAVHLPLDLDRTVIKEIRAFHESV